MSTKWTVDDEGNIRFTLVSNGMSPEQWGRYLKRRNFFFTGHSCEVLHQASEAPTKGVVYHVVVRPGYKIADNDRTINKIREHAESKGWCKPHWEVACLVRDKILDKQLELMHLWDIVAMHELIEDPLGSGPCLLASSRNGYRGVESPCILTGDELLDYGIGFAFVVPRK